MEQNPLREGDVHQEEASGRGGFFIETGAGRVAELAYRRTSADTVVLEHTEVSPTLRGSGAGGLLVRAAVAWARGTGTKLELECNYAKTAFERHPEFHDVLR